MSKDQVIKVVTDYANPIQYAMGNYLSVYEAFPSEYYFEITNDWYLKTSFERIIIGGGTTVTECTTYESTIDIFEGHFGSFNPMHMEKAENFHNSIFVMGEHISNSIDACYCYCVSKKDNGSIIAMPGKYTYYQIASGTTYSSGLSIGESTEPGDSFILASSASLGNMYPNKCSSYDGDHMSLVDTAVVIDNWIAKISAKNNNS